MARFPMGTVPYDYIKETRRAFLARGLCACGRKRKPGLMTCPVCYEGNKRRGARYAAKKKGRK